MAPSEPRPDLAAAERARRWPTALVVSALVELLGAPLVAYIANERRTATVLAWASGDATPDERTEARLRLALHVAGAIADHDGVRIAASWLQGVDPDLGERSPARLLREQDPAAVRELLVTAARRHLAN